MNSVTCALIGRRIAGWELGANLNILILKILAGWIQFAVKVVSQVFLGPQNDACELAIQSLAVSQLSKIRVLDRLPNWTCFELLAEKNAGCELGADWPSLHQEMSQDRIAGCELGADWF